MDPRGLLVVVGLAWLTLQPLAGISQPGEKKFTPISTPDGLSQGTVNSILKDKYGFMWFGTQDGLSKYDGINFTVYRSNPKNPRSLPENQVKCMLEDQHSNLWIGTLGGGLCYYDRNRDSFYRPQDLGFRTNEPINTAILSMCEDRQGRLWVGTYTDLLLVDRQHKIIRHFPAGIVQAIFEDARSQLWIGTATGLGKVLPGPGDNIHFERYTHDENHNSISNDQVLSISGDQHGRLWIGTLGGGLNMLDAQGHFSSWKTGALPGSISGNVVRSLTPADSDHFWVGTEDALDWLDIQTGIFTHYQKSPIGTGSISNNTVLSLLQDNTGILWAGTAEGGVNKYDPNLFRFDLYRKTSDPYSLSTDIVTSFAETPEGDIWIGTDGGGLNCWKRGSRQFIHFPPAGAIANGSSVNSAAILSLLIDRKKQSLWIGTFGGGLDRLDLHTGRFTYYRAGKGPHDISHDAIYALLEDKEGKIWMGTNGGGLDILDPASGIITRHRRADHPDSLSNDYIRCLLEDTAGRIWIGTYSSGINVFDPRTGEFMLLDKLNNHLSNQVVFSLLQDSRGRIWAGTMGGGLDMFDAAQRRFVNFNEDDGLCNNIVTAIAEDEKGFLWLSTKKGISRFDPRERKCRNYGIHNGIQDPEFSIGAVCRTNNNRILFGGINGFNVFNPREVRDNKIPPQTRFTGFLLKNTPLTGDLNNMDKLRLSYDQNDFTISYGSMSYTVPQDDRYTWILQGYDKVWTHATADRRATYTHVPPGDYLFRIRAANNDGVWNTEETTLPIHIAPPFWKTWWAWALYILFAAALLYFIYRDIATREKLRAQIRLERMTADKMKELNRIKLNFFTNASHELRTPLSLIMDPLRKITKGELDNREVQRYGSMMYNNAQRLMSLIDQMLDLRRLETGHEKLSPHPANIVMVTKNIAALFDLHARERKIEYSIRAPADELIAWIDQDKFEKIIFNLISNAFKYTPDGGTISVQIALPLPGGNMVAIHVRDTGIGIASHLKEKVFTMFYQVEGASRYEQGSTGIGLALTKELVELHRGRIELQSEPGKGSDFIVYIPLDQSATIPNETAAPVTEPVTALVTDPVTAPITSPVTDPASAPVATPVTPPVAGKTEDPNIVPITDPGMRSIPRTQTNQTQARQTNPVSELRTDKTPERQTDKTQELRTDKTPEQRTDKTQELRTDKTPECQTDKTQEFRTDKTPERRTDKTPEHQTKNTPGPTTEEMADDDSVPTILLVEDNNDLREYLAGELKNHYHVEEAPDGLKGYDLALQVVPDLVVSDIMMPGLNGLELCTRLKNDERISHIPVILLTARQADDHRIEGYDAGADAYIPKPFNMDLILVRIKNLLDSRRRLRESYNRYQFTTSGRQHAPSGDINSSSANNQTSSGDSQTSYGDKQIPSGNSQIPSGNSQISSGNNQISSANNQTTSDDNQISSNDNQISSNDNQISSDDNQTSSSGRQISSSNNQTYSGADRTIAPPAQPLMSVIDKQFLEKAARVVADNLSDITFDTDTLADKLSVSRRQLYRKIKALTDQTVHDFVTNIRLEKARTLLLTGELTVAEIAFKVGYSEPANFTRTFTRYYGKSPKKYIADLNPDV